MRTQGREAPRRLMEQGTSSMLESSLASSVSASTGEIGESTMGDACRRSAFTCCQRTPESLDQGERVLAKMTGEAQPWKAELCQRRVPASPSRRCCWQQGRA